MKCLSQKHRELLDKLADLSRQIEGHRATIAMLEHARLQLQTELRMAGYRPPSPSPGVNH